MKFQFILTPFLIFVFNFCFSQNTQELREAYTLKLSVDTATFYQQDVSVSKYFVKENILQIYPHEHLFIETEVKDDKVIAMIVVKENKNPSKTIEIKFTQNVYGRKSKGMTLIVSNPFNKSLSYNAMMYIVDNNKWIKTSIIPVKPKLQSIEIWNDTIISLVLSNWRLE